MAASEPATKAKMPPYYFDKIPEKRLRPDVRELLGYCKLPEDEIEPHLYRVRDKAWKVFPYPCVGLWSFIESNINNLEIYTELLQRLKSPSNQFIERGSEQEQKPCRVLDVCTGLGQDLRRLLLDGVPLSRVYASDITPVFWELGHDLWRDGEALKATDETKFQVMDLTSQSLFDGLNTGLMQYKSSFDFIFVGHLFHLLDYENNVRAAVNLANLTRGPGSEIMSWQLGGAGREIYMLAGTKDKENKSEEQHKLDPCFLNNEQSLKKIWEEEVPARTGMKFKLVKAWSKALPLAPDGKDWPDWMPPEGCLLEGWAKRVE